MFSKNEQKAKLSLLGKKRIVSIATRKAQQRNPMRIELWLIYYTFIIIWYSSYLLVKVLLQMQIFFN